MGFFHKILIDARVFKVKPKRGVAKHLKNIIQNIKCMNLNDNIIIYEGIFGEKLYRSKIGNLIFVFEEQFIIPLICLTKSIREFISPLGTAPIKLFWCNKTIILHDLIFFNYNKKYGIKSGMFFSSIYRSLCLKIALKNKETNIITISETTEKELQKNFPNISQSKIFRIANLYEASFTPIKRKNKKIVKKYFICVTGQARHKNYEVVLQAMDKIKQPNLHLKVVGINNGYTVRENIKYYNNLEIEELIKLYQNAEGLIFSSYEEGFGIPLLEAMSVNIPVICSDIPIFREIMGHNAIYFNPDSYKELISILINFDEKKVSFKYSSVLKKYSQEIIKSQVKEYFKLSTLS